MLLCTIILSYLTKKIIICLLSSISFNLIKICIIIGLGSEQSHLEQPLLVCTAHIHWDPEYCDVKLIQTMMLSNELRCILDEASNNFRPGHKQDNSVQLLLCGDFNSLPDSGKYIIIFNFP